MTATGSLTGSTSTAPNTEGDLTGASLQQLVAALDGLVPLRFVTVPTPMARFRSVGELRSDDLPEAGALLLAVDCRPMGREGVDAVKRASASSAAAVVLFGHCLNADHLKRAGRRHGVHVLLAADPAFSAAIAGVADEMLWSASRGRDWNVTPATDLFELSDRIAADVGGAICLESPHGDVLAYSTLEGQVIDQMRRNAILSRRAVVGAEHDDIYRSVWAASSIVGIPGRGALLPRVALGLRMAGVPVGAIFAISSPREVRRAGGRLALWASEAAASVFLHNARPNLAFSIDEVALASLLDESIPSLEPHHYRGGGQPLAVLAFDIPWSSRPAAHSSPDGLVQTAVTRLSAHCGVLAVSARGPVAYVVVTASTSTELDRAVRAAGSTIRQEPGLRLVGALGRPVRRLDLLARSRADADLALAFQRQRGSVGFVAYSDVAAGSNVVGIADMLRDHPELRLPEIESLLDANGSRTELADTVLAFLDGFGDVNKVAASLGIHANTLRYRLRMARQRNGIDLDDPDVRLLTWLRLRSVGGEQCH